MSAIIKANSATTIRSFVPNAASPDSAPSHAASEKDAEKEKRNALERENSRLNRELQEMPSRIETAANKARAEGRREGLELAKQDDERRIDTLADAAKRATISLEDRLKELDGLAALISKAALTKIFDNSFDRNDMVIAAIGRQMQRLRREIVLSIHVSESDFPDKASLDALKKSLSVGSVVIESTDLDSGSCKIDLQFGHIDASPDAQWRHLQTILDEMARDGA